VFAKTTAFAETFRKAIESRAVHKTYVARVLGVFPEGEVESHAPLRYSDEKVANRDTKVWHGATENGQ
jgi:23S rRNA-/tRNA-specific pseudouridylate synthase